MNFEKRKIYLTYNNLEYSFYYACNQKTTFNELLEYFASLMPSLNLCPCFQFQSNKDKKKDDDQGIIISDSSKIVEFSDCLGNLELKRVKKKCVHSTKILTYSKKQIIEYFQKEIEKQAIKNNNKINQLMNKIQSLSNEKVILSKPENKQNFYDVIIHIDSIKDINKGWKIDMNEIGNQNYMNYKKENILKLGVIGNANKGKAFILSKISRMTLPSGTSIKTEGLSIKYPDLTKHKNRKIALLDSAGLETPVLVSNEIKEEEKNELFKEKCREKLITELFLQNYIVHNSDILIVVVDCLSFSEQKLLMKVKKEIERSNRTMPLYVIHNLKTYTSIKQVQNYINDTLLKSATFTLQEADVIDTNEIKAKEGFKFFETNKEGKSSNIFHLIFANENSDAGNYYNQLTLNFIENSYQNLTNYKSYDVIQTIKERFIAVYKEIIEQIENITIESFDNSNPNLIKLKGKNEIILKKCLIDELGLSNLKSNGLEPKYNIFKKNDKIIIRVELPGNCTLTTEHIFEGEYCIIRIKGEKKKDVEPEKLEDCIRNIREFASFSFNIPLNFKDNPISRDKPKFSYLKGVYIIEYTLEKVYGPQGPEPNSEPDL